MNEQYIGVTGITSVDDVVNMNESLDGHFGMYGILISRKHMCERNFNGKWASLSDIPELMSKMPEDSLRTIHWCDNKLELNYLDLIMNLSDNLCNAIQLNMKYPSLDVLKEFEKKYTEVKIIYQVNKSMFKDPKLMAQELEPYSSFIDYVIIDQSGGAGILIDSEVSREVAAAFEKFDVGIVFAGGLTAQSVYDIKDIIREFNASTDSEKKLMDSNDKLENIKVKEYIKAGLKAMEKI